MSLFQRKGRESEEPPAGVIRSSDGKEAFVPVEMLSDLADAYPRVQLLTRPDRPGIFVGVRLEAVEAEIEREADRMAGESAEAAIPGRQACGVRKSDRAEKDALASDWWFSRTLARKPQRPCSPPSLAIRSGGLRSAQTHAWR
jgi:hypothetical protein